MTVNLISGHLLDAAAVALPRAPYPTAGIENIHRFHLAPDMFGRGRAGYPAMPPARPAKRRHLLLVGPHSAIYPILPDV